ncbi:GTP-binding protein ERG isoform X1 [Humulus lupulus]|uniref:GTP-binding protein ERG isoform X1 n=1 Tax=Humulus lupulus TaxID=3486 RepID=UPI002B411AF8|nr:GTP-binding protein ERG isoform X1 [Humulus lupulus]
MLRMKALRALRTLTVLSPKYQNISLRFYAAQPQKDDPAHNFSDTENGADSVFDSAHFTVPSLGSDAKTQPTWDKKYRERADQVIFGEEPQKKGKLKIEEQEEEKRRRVLAKALLEAALEKADEDDEQDLTVKEEDQKSLSVGIVGAPNAGKSSLTNYMVGTKVAAVSRKTHTTTHEVLGVLTKGDTQMCFFDTPGLTLTNNGQPHKDLKVRVESAWSSIQLYDVVIVIFDVQRHLTRPDARVIGLIKHMGAKSHAMQKRVLCMNKVDLAEKKKDLLKVAEQFKDLPGFERHFMISGLKGSGVKDLSQYLMEQALKRPWDEDPFVMSEEIMKNISLEVVRERLLDHIHQEIPYGIEHRLMDWKELRNGSLRIEQHLITNKLSQRKILVGKNGSKIGVGLVYILKKVSQRDPSIRAGFLNLYPFHLLSPARFQDWNCPISFSLACFVILFGFLSIYLFCNFLCPSKRNF